MGFKVINKINGFNFKKLDKTRLYKAICYKINKETSILEISKEVILKNNLVKLLKSNYSLIEIKSYKNINLDNEVINNLIVERVEIIYKKIEG